jgi:hypothetical protein
VEYSGEFQQKLADELEALPTGFTAIPTVIVDYKRERDQLRACQ